MPFDARLLKPVLQLSFCKWHPAIGHEAEGDQPEKRAPAQVAWDWPLYILIPRMGSIQSRCVPHRARINQI